MSKKDIIFVALLMNIAILSVLISFATSGSTTHQEPIPVTSSVAVEPSVVHKGVETSSPVAKKNFSSLDEIDALLEEYLPPDTTLIDSETKDTPVLRETPAAPSNVLKAKPAAVSAPLRSKKADESKEQTKMYTIQPGDNPWKIAKKFHISFEKLLELNHLNEAKAKNLKAGQKLRIQE